MLKNKNKNIKRQKYIYHKCNIFNLDIDGKVLVFFSFMILVIKPELLFYLLTLIKIMV